MVRKWGRAETLELVTPMSVALQRERNRAYKSARRSKPITRSKEARSKSSQRGSGARAGGWRGLRKWGRAETLELITPMSVAPQREPSLQVCALSTPITRSSGPKSNCKRAEKSTRPRACQETLGVLGGGAVTGGGGVGGMDFDQSDTDDVPLGQLAEAAATMVRVPVPMAPRPPPPLPTTEGTDGHESYWFLFECSWVMHEEDTTPDYELKKSVIDTNRPE